MVQNVTPNVCTLKKSVSLNKQDRRVKGFVFVGMGVHFTVQCLMTSIVMRSKNEREE